jgi:hypothetical protein
MDSTPAQQAAQPPHTLDTSDMYEAGYYLCLGFDIRKVEIIHESKKTVGRFSFAGDGLTQAQIDYFNGHAVVNLLSFRRAYIRLNSVAGAARRNERIESKAFPEDRQGA